MVNKNFSVLMCFLSAILVLVLSFFMYRIVTHLYYVNSHVNLGISQYASKYTTNKNSSTLSKVTTFRNTNNKTPITGFNK